MTSLTPNNGAFFYLQLVIPVVSVYFLPISVSTIKPDFCGIAWTGPLGNLWRKDAEVCFTGELAKGQ